MAKQVDKLVVKISVEHAEEALVKAMGISKSKFIEWREIMAAHGYFNRAQEIQEYIDVLNNVSEGKD